MANHLLVVVGSNVLTSWKCHEAFPSHFTSLDTTKKRYEMVDHTLSMLNCAPFTCAQS